MTPEEQNPLIEYRVLDWVSVTNQLTPSQLAAVMRGEYIEVAPAIPGVRYVITDSRKELQPARGWADYDRQFLKELGISSE